MRKFGKVSLLLIALSTGTVGGNFYLSNLSQDDSKWALSENYKSKETSTNVYLNITNIMFQEDLKVKVKYTIQANNGVIVNDQFISETMYGTEFVVMQKGDTNIGGAGEVERVAFEPTTLTPGDSSDSSGSTTSDPIQLNNGLYEKGEEYDAYIVWHEFNEDGSLNDTWYQTTPSTFTTPVSDFPTYSLRNEFEGASQSLVSFNVNYDESLTIDEIGLNNTKYFFDILRLNWEDDSESHSTDVSDVIQGDTTSYENIWLDWDYDNHKFSYYLLIDNLSTERHDVTYQFIYNGNNFGTTQKVDNIDSPLRVRAGNRYSNAPKINYSYTTPEDPTTLADYQKVDLHFSVSENEVWKDEYDMIMSSLGYDTDYFELKPINSMTNITIDNIVSESGEQIDGVVYNTEQVNNYNEDLSVVTIKGLDPGTTYTADATLNLNDDIFTSDSVVLPIEFSTLDTVNQPTLSYVDDENLDGSEFTNWSRDVLKFNLSPGDWVFDDALITPGELFETGDIKFYNKGVLESEATIDQIKLSTLVEGENYLDTSSLGINLKAGTDYTFTLDLTYTSKAQGLFDAEVHPTINGSFTTQSQIIMPTLRFAGSDLVAGNKSSMDLRFEIVDDTKVFSGTGEEPLTLNKTFEELKIIDFKEVADGELIDNENIDFTDTIDSSELVTSDVGQNTINVTGLKGGTTYEFTAVLTLNDTANSQDPDGWVPYDEDGQIEITKRVSTDSKFEAFDVQVEEVSTTKDEGKPTWTSVIEVRVPNGGENVSGINSPNADVNISYELYDYDQSATIMKDTIGAADWIVDSTTDESYCQLEFKNLSPSNTYKFSTITSFNDDVMVGVNDTTKVITTGKNNGFTNDMLNAEWGVRDQNKVEEENVYSDIFISLNVNEDNANNQEFLDGYQSIQLIDPYGAVVDSNSDLVLSADSKPMLWLDKPFKPKTTLSGYKVKIVNNENTVDSGVELSLPDFYLSGLLEPIVTEKSINVSPTSMNASLNFSNYNNVEYVEYEISEKATGDVVWTSTESSDKFTAEDSGNLDISISTGEGVLESETNYTLTVNTFFKDVVESVEDHNTLNVDFTTTPKNTITPEFVLESSYESVKVNYSWVGNNNDTYKLNEISAKILSPKDNYSNEISAEQSVLIDETAGSGSFEFLGLDSGIEYKVVFELSYDGIAEPVIYEEWIETNEKSKTFNSSFELLKNTESSLELDYRYEGFVGVETANTAAVTDINFYLYDGDVAVGTPLFEYDPVISGLPPAGGKSFILEDEDKIKPAHTYTVVEEVTYSSFKGWTTNDGLGEPNYDKISQSETTTVEYDPSVVTSNIEFLNENTLNVQIVIDDVGAFDNGGELNVSLVSDGKPVSFILNGVTNVADNVSLDTLDLYPYLTSDSTDDKHIYEVELNGVYVEEGKSINLDLNYGNEYCGSSAEQTYESLIDPNSIKALDRYEYTSSYYVYELSVDASDRLDLNEDILFTEKDSTNIQSSEVMVLDKVLLDEEIMPYDSNNIYIKVNKSIATSSDWRDLRFMVGRYIVINNPARTLIDFSNQSAYYISGFDMIPMPKEPLTLKDIIVIILLTILFILLLWLILYKILKYYRKEKWYEYALNKANAYYFMHRKNMNMYGWSHKFNEYESLNNMNIPELKEYAKKLNLPIAYGLNKKELVDTLSLLTPVELERIKEYSNYQLDISDKVREDLLEEFQTDAKESKWMKRRFKYVIDRANRMQDENYSKSGMDWFVDIYTGFDKVFVSFTDKVLIMLGIKKIEVKNVEVKDHDWDNHENSDDIKENSISSVDDEGGDSND